MSTIRGILSLVMMSLIVSMTPSRSVASATAAPRPNVPWQALRLTPPRPTRSGSQQRLRHPARVGSRAREGPAE